MFDLDNTLYDEHAFVKSGFKAVSEFLSHKFGLDEKTVYARLCNILIKEGRNQVFSQVLTDFAVYNDEIVSDMLEVYRKHLPQISIFKDTHYAISLLREEYKLGLITDGLRMVQESKVEALKIGSWFDAIIYAYDYGGKYSPKPFLLMLKRLQVKACESVYVDDNPCKGFSVANELGIRTVRILRGEYKDIVVDDERNRPDLEINNLYQLVTLIKNFNESP
jgi:putative hydrolase of the HAD superfamily